MTVIVTRHAGLVEWLKRRGIEGEVVSHAGEDTVRDRHVYGVLPYRLAALAGRFTEVSLVVPPELRGKELTADDIDGLNPQMTEWRVFGEDDAVFSEEDARAVQEQIGVALDACVCFRGRLDKKAFKSKEELEGYARSMLAGIDKALDSVMRILAKDEES